MGRHLNCGGDLGAERRCFGELSKKQDDDMDNFKVGNVSKSGMVLIPKPTCGLAVALAFGVDNLVERKAADDIVAAPV